MVLFCSRGLAQETAPDAPGGELARELAAELRDLFAQHANATPEFRRDALSLWHKQNAPRLQELERRLAASIRADERAASNEPIQLPADASPKMRKFLSEEAALSSERLEIEQTLANANPRPRRDALAAWTERNQARFKAQEKLASELLPEQSVRPATPPAVPEFPVEASAKERRFQTEEIVLAHELLLLTQQCRDLTPERRRNAFADWRARNAARLAAQQKLASEIEIDQKQSTTQTQ